MDTLWGMWKKSIKIPNTHYTISGFSIAALRSNFYIPELKLMLDAGLSANFTPDNILITHNHSDHIANIPYHLYGTFEKIVNIFAPAESYNYLDRYIKTALSTSHNCEPTSEKFAQYMKNRYEIFPMFTNSIVEITSNGSNLQLEVIKSYHSVPCVSYGICKITNKLRDEFKELNSKELVILKKTINITYKYYDYFLLYVGDTSHEILLNKEIYKYKNIMIECTFLDPNDLEQALETMHIHWLHLEPIIKEHQEINFILYHFSQRYNIEYINNFFKDNNTCTNVYWWTSS